MNYSLTDRLLRRELDGNVRQSSVRGIYGDKAWVGDLDIVNELAGHHGCVNALSWSKSGRLLASGSDDTNILLHQYQADSAVSPFTLSTEISTGHTANIFSVKFMPHSNDNTIVSAAGDCEVRVFDVEYSAKERRQSGTASRGGAGGVQYLYPGNTNARIYRSHADRVKRIVTESSPYLFLTCSEDGDVRQWDLRLPSTAYPPPRAGRMLSPRRVNTGSAPVPPPLISYRRFRLDLNTISCSASQPHYIVLGGAHLHCFLHDRRMLGRDLPSEQGRPSPISSSSDDDDEEMGYATRCVRRFAPKGQKTMSPLSNGHVTACKISDANPNEMIASYSGNHIYSFNLVAPEEDEEDVLPKQKKRKRKQDSTRSDAEPAVSRPRRSSSVDRGDVALRVRYENGQSEDIALETSMTEANVEQARDSVLSEPQKRSQKIAKSVVKLRRLLFSLDSAARDLPDVVAAHEDRFSEAYTLAAAILPEMDRRMAAWQYPVEPSPDELAYQNMLRSYRDRSRRFVQAAGVLAKTLGGTLRSGREETFDFVKSTSLEKPAQQTAETFRYDFLKAILAWLTDGVPCLEAAFQRSAEHHRVGQRFPIPEEHESDAAIDEYVMPYLLSAAGDASVVDLDASRFEHDDSRIMFGDEFHAVTAFDNAIKLPKPGPDEEARQTEATRAARRYWGFKVGRSVLMKAGEGVDFALVDHAFGGLGTGESEERSQADIDPDEADPAVESISRITSGPSRSTQTRSEENLLLDDDGSELEPDDSDSGDDEFDDGSEHMMGTRHILWHSHSGRAKMREKVDRHVPVVSHNRIYRGHCNVKTVKDVNFYGLDDEYVVSGSDSGHLFIWDRKTTKLLNILEGDGEVVNVIQGHPYEPMLAVSGIDHTIKIFGVDRRAQRDARQGVNLNAPSDESANFSTLSWSRARRRQRGVRRTTSLDAEPRPPAPSKSSDEEEPESDENGNKPRRNARGGLTSRRRMKYEYNITAQNDIERQGGLRDARITRGMLQEIAQQIRLRNVAGLTDDGDDDGDGEGNQTIVLDENCSVM